ncbi:MAG: hypothetical protein UU93_C0015G0017 [Candidatus Amesbacteria bacterium GW2011_GWA2_42_12]|uniref:Uncharacterized protein n=1 Tax=Candidatus Amesbacteria bacterium GW2011_GWA2_42_12 TaxID=1618356 RepID=A0A0G1B2E4_9BACT|nr:MAG: hypothetical protein UU93_C0015G0017 [Candidatus Amesbacteria bacterium GW2011_GWA2_42_12]OGY15486.1 MAG: hypothetical protein A3I52_01285 [Candidatus Blackburnbacteria bacterium RIFCSPLOWO2_02_FULL_40_10]
MSLPTVSKETSVSVAQGIASDSLFLKNFYENLKNKNPQIVLMVAELMKITGDNKTVLITAAAVYKMLESQVEADDLKKGFLF